MNPFHTRYFCWLDVGLFRDLADPQPFSIHIPPGFSDDSVAYQEVTERNPNASMTDIIYNNAVWVCGCFFIGQGTVLLNWVAEYKVCLSVGRYYTLA